MIHRLAITSVVLIMIASTGAARASDPSSPSAVCIEHIGETDKYIMGIAISDSPAGIELCRKDSEGRVGLPDLWEHVLDSTRIVRLIEIADSTPNDQHEHPHAFGTLAVVIIQANNKHVLLINKDDGATFLGKLKRSCDDRSLRSHLATLRAQISR